jgi:DNA-binding MarR family transcriptional regulator
MTLDDAANDSPSELARSLNDAFTPITMGLFRHQGTLNLTSDETVVLMNLLSFWWKPDGLPFPSSLILARRMRVSIQTVQRAIENLEKKELIKRIWNLSDGRSSVEVSHYDLRPLVTKLKKLGL